MGTHTVAHMGEARVLAHTRMGYPYAYGQPIRVRVAHTHMGCQYAYGLPMHMRMGRIPVWDGTSVDAVLPFCMGLERCMLYGQGIDEGEHSYWSFPWVTLPLKHHKIS